MAWRLMRILVSVAGFGLLVGSCNWGRLDTLKRMSPEERRAVLFKATKEGNTAEVKRCIDAGVSVNEPEEAGGWTALHFAVHRLDEGSVTTLLAAGADPDIEGVAPGPRSGTIVSTTPATLANVQLSVFKTMEGMFSKQELELRMKGTEMEALVKDPKTEERMERIAAILRKASKNPPVAVQ